MRRLVLVAFAAILAAAIALPVVAATPSGFAGTWSSIDPVDGSTQHLSVRGGPAHVQIQYVDEFGTTCVDVGAPTTVFTGVLTGTISGNEMSAWFKAAGCGPRIVLRASDFFSWFFEYDPNTDTLWGAINDGPATWHRD